MQLHPRRSSCPTGCSACPMGRSSPHPTRGPIAFPTPPGALPPSLAGKVHACGGFGAFGAFDGRMITRGTTAPGPRTPRYPGAQAASHTHLHEHRTGAALAWGCSVSNEACRPPSPQPPPAEQQSPLCNFPWPSCRPLCNRPPYFPNGSRNTNTPAQACDQTGCIEAKTRI